MTQKAFVTNLTQLIKDSISAFKPTTIALAHPALVECVHAATLFVEHLQKNNIENLLAERIDEDIFHADTFPQDFKLALAAYNNYSIHSVIVTGIETGRVHPVLLGLFVASILMNMPSALSYEHSQTRDAFGLASTSLMSAGFRTILNETVDTKVPEDAPVELIAFLVARMLTQADAYKAVCQLLRTNNSNTTKPAADASPKAAKPKQTRKKKASNAVAAEVIVNDEVNTVPFKVIIEISQEGQFAFEEARPLSEQINHEALETLELAPLDINWHFTGEGSTTDKQGFFADMFGEPHPQVLYTWLDLPATVPLWSHAYSEIAKQLKTAEVAEDVLHDKLDTYNEQFPRFAKQKPMRMQASLFQYAKYTKGPGAPFMQDIELKVSQTFCLECIFVEKADEVLAVTVQRVAPIAGRFETNAQSKNVAETRAVAIMKKADSNSVDLKALNAAAESQEYNAYITQRVQDIFTGHVQSLSSSRHRLQAEAAFNALFTEEERKLLE